MNASVWVRFRFFDIRPHNRPEDFIEMVKSATAFDERIIQQRWYGNAKMEIYPKVTYSRSKPWWHDLDC